jgi:two-component system OmpR family response regulator
MRTILVIEDEERTAQEIVEALIATGARVTLCTDGTSGLRHARQGGFDAITLDRLLPGMDGLELLAQLRDEGDKTPVLVISALGEVDDRVRGLRAGGDDYLIKPFSLVELVARIEALTRRRDHESGAAILVAGPLRMDLLQRRVSRNGRVLDITQREFRLLEYLARNAGQLLTRSMLYEAVWDYKFDPGTNLIDVHIGRLRRKVDLDGEAPLIITIRGSGWMFDAPA